MGCWEEGERGEVMLGVVGEARARRQCEILLQSSPSFATNCGRSRARLITSGAGMMPTATGGEATLI